MGQDGLARWLGVMVDQDGGEGASRVAEMVEQGDYVRWLDEVSGQVGCARLLCETF